MKKNIKQVIITSLFVGLFHFFMPLIGNFIGVNLFLYTIFKPKYILFLVFLMLGIDMFISYLNDNHKNRKLNIIGIILFSFSVSFDSLTVGLGISYLYNNIISVVTTFSCISAIFTFMGFYFGNILSKKIGKYAYLIGSIAFLLYSIWMLTN